MHINSEFIKKLRIPFSEALPSGAIKEIREKFGVSEHTPTKVLRGDWSNPEITREALKRSILHHQHTGVFIGQFPRGLVSELKEEIGLEASNGPK